MFRIITGGVIFLVGLWLLYLGAHEGLGAIIPGLVVAAIGTAIILNKKEDKIEEIKSKDNTSEHHE